jgi:hypothetical protein
MHAAPSPQAQSSQPPQPSGITPQWGAEKQVAGEQEQVPEQVTSEMCHETAGPPPGATTTYF